MQTDPRDPHCPGDPPREAPAAAAHDAATAEAQARRYLDLWERNLSRLALDGRLPRGTRGP